MEFLAKLLMGGWQSLAVVPILLLCGAAIFIYVMTWNYRHLREESWLVDLEAGEQEVDRLEVSRLLQTVRTVLTDRRVLQQRLHWFLSRRRYLAVELKDVHSVVLRSHVHLLGLFIAYYLVGTINPLALLVLMYAAQTPVVGLRFSTVFSRMPLTRPGVRVPGRTRTPAFERFYMAARGTLARVRGREMTGVPAAAAPRSSMPALLEGFKWNTVVWVHVVALMALGALQRGVQGHLAFDDIFFTPLYLGLPVAAARRSLGDGLWAAILGFLGLCTVKFPSGGILGSLLLRSDGHPWLGELALVMLFIIAMVLFVHLVRRYVAASLSVFALLAWIPFVWLCQAASFADLIVLAQTAAAVAVAILGAWAYGRLEDSVDAKA